MVNLGLIDSPFKALEAGPLPAGGRGFDFSSRHGLRAFVHGFAGDATRQSSRHCLEPPARTGD